MAWRRRILPIILKLLLVVYFIISINKVGKFNICRKCIALNIIILMFNYYYSGI